MTLLKKIRDFILYWEPEQRTFTAHVIWRWTGALLQDIVRCYIPEKFR